MWQHATEIITNAIQSLEQFFFNYQKQKIFWNSKDWLIWS